MNNNTVTNTNGNLGSRLPLSKIRGSMGSSMALAKITIIGKRVSRPTLESSLRWTGGP